MANRTRPVRGLAALLLALIAGALAPAAGHDAVAANDTIASFSLSGTPFAQDLPPLPTRVTAHLILARKAKVTVRILKPNGQRVKALVVRRVLAGGGHSFAWDGMNASGQPAPDGLYQVVVKTENGLGTLVRKRQLRKGLPAIYPANPGVLVVAVDPGHGGRFAGAVRNGFAEKHFNLSISLKLRALLEHAGVQVVMTRTTDVAVLEPASDFNGDGKVNRYDDDLVRNDIKNLARADVAVHVHNNGSSDPAEHGTGTYIRTRTWTPLAGDLATLMVAEQFEALSAYESPQFTAHNNGVQYGRFYYYMDPYDPPFLARPSLVTSVLSESLYVSHPADLEMLKRDDVRTSLAAAIYIGLARWLNSRQLGIGYQLLSGPDTPVDAGDALTYEVRVTNRGNAASDGWTLQLHSVPAVTLYDGSGQVGDLMGAVAVPDGLQPGESVELTVNGTAPTDAGDWLVKADVRLPDDLYASFHGVGALQVPLTTTAP